MSVEAPVETAPDDVPSHPRVFYKIDSTRVSFREYWWGSPLAAILVAPVLKALRIRIPSATDDPNVERLSPFEVDAAPFPEEVAARLAPLQKELEAQGFVSPIHHCIDDAFHKARTYLVTYRHPSAQTVARIHNRIWGYQVPPKSVLFGEYLSEFTNGTYLWSLSSKPDLAAPPACTVLRAVGATATDLWKAHGYAVQREGRNRTLQSARTDDELRALVERHHASVRNFHLGRGVFVAMSEGERSGAIVARQEAHAAAAEGSRHPEILAELRRLEQGQTSWMNTLLVLVASLALFVGAGVGGMTFSVDTLLILVPVLLFHEGGHYVAMRLFNYRNLRMFFIPFFGAAVSGRNYNVPGWKKAVVSLMGPVPGIFIGSILGALGLVLGKPLLMSIALMALALNGFNLLPVLPLDGGWAMHAIFFARSLALDVCFRVAAVLGLLAVSIWSGDSVLRYLAIFMAIGIPLAYKLAKVARALRRSGLSPVSSDDQTISSAVADTIIDAVQAELRSRATPKQVAQHSLYVFETLNARPPGWAATIGLAAVHGLSLGAAIVFAVLIVIGQSGSLAGLVNAAATLPPNPLDPATILTSEGPSPASALSPTVVATFADDNAARRAFEAHRPSAGVPLRLFGRTLLVRLPVADDSARKKWLTQLGGQGAETLVGSRESPASGRLSCVGQTDVAAKEMEESAKDYFQAGAAMHLLPPWIHPDPRTPAEQASHRRARRTHALLATPSLDAFRSAGTQELVQKMVEARRQGDLQEVESLKKRMEKASAEARRQHIEHVRASADADPVVVERFLALGELGNEGWASPRRAAEMGPLLGQFPLMDGRPEPGTDATAANGWVSREGLLLSFQLMSFADVFEGPPKLVHWLQSKGCLDFRYEFQVGVDLDAEGLSEQD